MKNVKNSVILTLLTAPVILLSAVLFSSCPQMGDLLGKRDIMQQMDPPVAKAVFSAPPVLTLKTGTLEDGDISYSWTPAAAHDLSKPVTYRLYIAAGDYSASETAAQDVQASGTSISGGPRAIGVFPGTAGVQYSAVVVASQNGVSIESAVRQAFGKTLTEEGGNPDAPVFSSVPVLTWQTGSADGKISYSWTDAALVTSGGTITYTLYIAKGEHGKAALIANGTPLTVTGSDDYSGDKGAVYSAILKAASGGVSVYSRVKTAVAKADYDLRFGVISDVYVGAEDHGTEDFSAVDRLEKALQWYRQQEGVRAVAITGNIIDGAGGAEAKMKTQWNAAKNVFSKYTYSGASDEANDASSANRMKLIAVMGSREAQKAAAANGGGTTERAEMFTDYTGQRPNARYVLTGSNGINYHFITVNAGADLDEDTQPEDIKGGAASSAISEGSAKEQGVSTANDDDLDIFSTEVKTWLTAQLAAAQADSPGKPIFVFIHWPLKNTVYVSEDTVEKRYTTSFDGFSWPPQAVVFSGHLRSPNSDPRSIWQNGFTAVNAGTLLSYQMESGYKGGVTALEPAKSPQAASDAAATGMIVTVKGSEVTITNHDFDPLAGNSGTVTQMSQTWTFDTAAALPYTPAIRDGQKTAPVFPGAAAATISGVTEEGPAKMGFTVTFDQAVMPPSNPGGEAVHHYEFELTSDFTGMTESLGKQWSDFMLPARLRQSSLTQSFTGITMEPGAGYTLKITAVGSLGARSTSLSKPFQAPGVFNPIKYKLTFNGNLTNTAEPVPGQSPRPATVYSFKGNSEKGKTTAAGGAEVYETGIGSSQSFKVETLYESGGGKSFIRLDDNRTNNTPDPSTAFNYNQSFTIAFWVKVNSATGTDPVLFSNKLLNSNYTAAQWSTINNGREKDGLVVYLSPEANGKRDIRLNSKSVSDSGRLLSGGSEITIARDVLTKWVHITAVYDKTAGSGQVRYYANGVLVGSMNTDLSRGIKGDSVSYIGNSGGNSTEMYTRSNSTYAMNCNIQNFILQGGAMTDTEIEGLVSPYISQSSVTAPTLSSLTAPVVGVGRLNYSWTIASLEEWVVYKLYYRQGNHSNAADIVSGGSSIILSATGSGVLSGLTGNETYSVVIAATRVGSAPAYSSVFSAVSSNVDVKYNLSFNNTLNNAEAYPTQVYMYNQNNDGNERRLANSGTATYENGLNSKQSLKVNMVSGFVRLDDDRLVNGADEAIAFNYNQSFTIAFWVKVNSAGLNGNELVLFSNKPLGASLGNHSWLTGNSGGNGRKNTGLAFYLEGSGANRSIKLSSKSANETDAINEASGIVIKDNVLDTWVHVAAVYDTTAGTNGQVRYYANGTRVGAVDTDLRGGIDGGNVSYIGSSGSSNGTNATLYTRVTEFKDYTMNFNIQDFILKGGAMTDAEVDTMVSTSVGTVTQPTLTCATGTAGNGEITYSWTASSLGVIYNLYIAQGNLTAAQLKATTPVLTTGTAVTTTTAYSVPAENTVYSALVTATLGNVTVESNVATATSSEIYLAPALVFKPGTAAGELSYSWFGKSGVTYELYVARGAGFANAAAVISAASSTPIYSVTPAANGTVSGTLTTAANSIVKGVIYTAVAKATQSSDTEFSVVKATFSQTDDRAYWLKFNGNLNNSLSTPSTVYVQKMNSSAAVQVSGPANYADVVERDGKSLNVQGSKSGSATSAFVKLDDNGTDTSFNAVSTSFNYDQSFTIAFWVKLNSFASHPVLFSNKHLVSSAANPVWTNGNGNANNGFAIYAHADGSIRLQSKSVSDSEQLGTVNANLTIAQNVVGTWVHVAAVYDKTGGTSGQVRYYANGVKIGEENTDLSGGMSSGKVSFIGNSASGGNQSYFRATGAVYAINFDVQDFLLAPGTLTDAEIAALHSGVVQ